MAFLGAAAGILSTVASVAGTAVGIMGSMAAANYQAKLAEYNAQIATQNALRAEERGMIEAQDNDMATLGMLGEQEAAQTASGISLRSKSAAARRAARQLGRRDTLNIVQGSKIEGYNYRVEAASQKAQGQMAQQAGKMNALSSFLSLGGSLIGDAKSTGKSFSGGGGTTANPNDPWYGLRRKTA